MQDDLSVCCCIISTFQVPFSWLLLLMPGETVVNTLGSIKFGLQSQFWLMGRYIPALLLALAVAAAQHVHGRRQFCARHGIVIGGGRRVGV